MSVRPNIQSMSLDGKDLTVHGETDADELPTGIFVVVTQDTAAGAARASAAGIADRAGSGWRAELKETAFQKGAAQAMGVEVHVNPFQSTSWVQSLTID